MSFVHVKLKGSRCGYVAESEIAEVDPILEQVTLRDGRKLEVADHNTIPQLISGGIVRGVSVDDGTLVSVPLASIDHVADTFDEAAGEWLAIATTARGLRFAVDPIGRAALGLDDEIYAAEELREAVARPKAADPVAEAAVAEAEEAAGGLRRKAG